jgi:hypothetical protein
VGYSDQGAPARLQRSSLVRDHGFPQDWTLQPIHFLGTQPSVVGNLVNMNPMGPGMFSGRALSLGSIPSTQKGEYESWCSILHFQAIIKQSPWLCCENSERM